MKSSALSPFVNLGSPIYHPVFLSHFRQNMMHSSME
jgi:hypothetical protein